MVTCVGCNPPENFWNLKPGNAISCILSIQKIIKLLTIIYHHLVVDKLPATRVASNSGLTEPHVRSFLKFFHFVHQFPRLARKNGHPVMRLKNHHSKGWTVPLRFTFKISTFIRVGIFSAHPHFIWSSPFYCLTSASSLPQSATISVYLINNPFYPCIPFLVKVKTTSCHDNTRWEIHKAKISLDLPQVSLRGFW